MAIPRARRRRPFHIALVRAAVSTSGDAEQWMTVDGVRRSHVIDLRTGWPVTGRSATSVVAAHGIDADAVSTALGVLDADAGARLLQTVRGPRGPVRGASALRRCGSASTSPAPPSAPFAPLAGHRPADLRHHAPRNPDDRQFRSFHAGLAAAASSPPAWVTRLRRPCAAQCRADNTLTAAEQSAGWQLLFDGKIIDKWRGYNTKEIPASWSIVDGAITATKGKGADLVSVDENSATSSSRSTSRSRRMATAASSTAASSRRPGDLPQRARSTRCSTTRPPRAKNGPDRFCGTNYDVDPPLANACKPAGEWNSAKILVKGAHVEHWLNGRRSPITSCGSPSGRPKVAASKFKAWPDYGMATSGRLSLQDHGDEVAFSRGHQGAGAQVRRPPRWEPPSLRVGVAASLLLPSPLRGRVVGAHSAVARRRPAGLGPSSAVLPRRAGLGAGDGAGFWKKRLTTPPSPTPPGGDDLAVLRRHGGRPVLRHRADPGGAAPRRRGAALRLDADTFGAFYPVLIAYTLCYMPTLALTNSLSFHQMSDPGREFPGIRVLGTIGWIVAGMSSARSARAERRHVPACAAAASIVLGLFCLALPHTPPSAAGGITGVRDVLGLDALSADEGAARSRSSCSARS